MLSLKPKSLAADKSDKIGRILVFVYLAMFFCFLVLPLFALMSKSMQNADGVFVGLENFALYLKDPTLFKSFFHSLFVASVSTVIVVCLGFLYAFALQCTCIPFKGLFRVVSLIPLLSPSILAAIALVYWFGNQGVFKEILLGHSIYGPIGIIMASVYWTFPHALMILSTSLSLSDARLYEASDALKASKLRTFFTVTIPGAKYGIISTTFVVFILVFTDFGVPKVIGGNYNGHHKKELVCTIKNAFPLDSHPILHNVKLPFTTPGSLYRNSPLPHTSTPLLLGSVKGFPSEPVAWINKTKFKGKVFYTSLGHIEDFNNPAFNELLIGAIKWCLEND